MQLLVSIRYGALTPHSGQEVLWDSSNPLKTRTCSNILKEVRCAMEMIPEWYKEPAVFASEGLKFYYV